MTNLEHVQDRLAEAAITVEERLRGSTELGAVDTESLEELWRLARGWRTALRVHERIRRRDADQSLLRLEVSQDVD